MSDQTKTSSDKQSLEKHKAWDLPPYPTHYNHWGSSGKCKPKVERPSDGSRPKYTIEEIYFMDENGFDVTYFSPW